MKTGQELPTCVVCQAPSVQGVDEANGDGRYHGRVDNALGLEVGLRALKECICKDPWDAAPASTTSSCHESSDERRSNALAIMPMAACADLVIAQHECQSG